MAANPEELQSLVRKIATDQFQRQFQQAASRSSSRAPSPIPSAPEYIEYTAPSKASRFSPEVRKKNPKNYSNLSTPDLTLATVKAKASDYNLAGSQTHTATNTTTRPPTPFIQTIHVSDPQILAQIEILDKHIENIIVQNIRLQRKTTKSLSILSHQVIKVEKDLQQLEKKLNQKKSENQCVIWTAFTIFCVFSLVLIITIAYFIGEKN